mgnify:CR=1 FL=1
MKIDFLMYKVVLALLAMAGVAKTSYAQQEQDMSRGYPNHRVLVAYFSATGTTARVAGKVAQATGGELYAITPAESYTSADQNPSNESPCHPQTLEAARLHPIFSVIPFGGILRRVSSIRSSKVTI